MKIRVNIILHILLAALCLMAPWLEGFSAVMTLAWIPLFFFWERVQSKIKKILGTYVIFVLWNLGVTWWIYRASAGGAALAILANSALMTAICGLYFNISEVIKTKYSIFLFIPLWMSFEYMHQYWDLSWTWLTLGNAFSDHPSWIRGYSITGVAGGTLWALLSNAVGYSALRFKNIKISYFLILLYIIPVLNIFWPEAEKALSRSRKIRYIIVQPNIDPYNEKFYYDFDFLYDRTRKLIEKSELPPCDLMIFPETFITYDLNEDALNRDEIIERFRKDFIESGRVRYILTGASTYHFYRNDSPSSTARKDKASGMYYDMFNTALWITKDTTEVYHKSILVPGVEKMPFPRLFGFLEHWALDMGGTSGSLGTQAERAVFRSDEGWAVAPIICYESVYGEYIGDYIRKGADLLCVITNDGWWGNTPGHRQHLRFGTLRCVEYRVPMLRSANTGISAAVNEEGSILQSLAFEKEGVLYGEISLPFFRDFTIYARWGDILSRLMLGGSAMMVLFFILKNTRQRLKIDNTEKS